MSLTTKSNLIQRLIVSAIVVPIVLLIIFFAEIPLFKPAFVLIVAAVASLALAEFYQLAKTKGYEPLLRLGITTTAFYMAATFIAVSTPHLEFLPLGVMAAALLAGFARYFAGGSSPMTNLSVTFFGLFYLTVPLSCLIAITYFFHFSDSSSGRWWLLYLLIVAKLTDTAAYFAGKAFGRRKLAPYISPNKSWEGTVAGLTAAAAASLLYAYGTSALFEKPLIDLPLGTALWLGLLISIFAQFGDLTESLIKRDAGVKDSSQLPGLGGFLDLVDSLIFTAPLLYLYLKFGA